MDKFPKRLTFGANLSTICQSWSYYGHTELCPHEDDRVQVDVSQEYYRWTAKAWMYKVDDDKQTRFDSECISV